MEKICKIVYFDEDSVTDYVQIVAGGELENTTELLKSRDAQEAQSVQANGKVGISGIFKALLGWEAGASADVSAGLSFNSSKMVKNIVKNTILTDFLKTIEDVSQGRTNSRLPKGTIKQFKGYKISAVEDSLSYMVMVSPYLSMLKSGSSIPAGEFNIAVDKLDNALRHAKGYYEFVGTKGRSRVILRFNINSCNGVQREHNKKLNNGLPILHKVPPKRDYGRYFCIMAEKGGTSHGGLTEKLSPFFHAKKQEVNAYGR